MFHNRTPLQKLLLLKAFSSGGQSFVERTATGNPLMFGTDVSKPLKSLVANFLPVQASGTPAPDNILPITGWDAVNVFHAGKNILALTSNSPIKDIDTGSDTTIKRTNLEIGAIYEGVTQNNYWRGETASRYIVSRANGGLTFATNDGAYGFGVCVPLNPNTKYTLSYTGEGVAIRIAQYAKDGTHVKGTNLGSTNPITFTSAGDVAYALIILTCDSNYTKQEVAISNVLLEVGETASTYEQYNGTVYPATFHSTIYGGYVDLITGEVWATWLAVDMAQMGFSYRSGWSCWVGNVDSRLANVGANTEATKALLEWAKAVPASGYTSAHNHYTFAQNTNGAWFVDNNSDETAPTGTLVCPLASPVLITTLTPQQINAIKNQTNTIWSDANGDCSVTFLKKG